MEKRNQQKNTKPPSMGGFFISIFQNMSIKQETRHQQILDQNQTYINKLSHAIREEWRQHRIKI